MDIHTLEKRLLEAYSPENLNKIAATLLLYYKNREFSILQSIAGFINEFVPVEIDQTGKGFSTLMMLYHPDRADFHKKQIEKLALINDFDKLLEYSHILHLERMDEIALVQEELDDIDYSPVYEWDLDTEGFHEVKDTEDPDENLNRGWTEGEMEVTTFFDAVKIRNYGHTDIDFPTYYLEDFEEFELSASDINDLDGIQYCVHAKTFDLSDNFIYDLELLKSLTSIEDLNLADNEIGYIDAVGYLKNLHRLNLSNNKLSDISPLFELENLEYVCISGNNIDFRQIERLIAIGIEVEF